MQLFPFLVSAGAQCCTELSSFAEAIRWCDRGLKMYPADGKLQELRSAADKQKVRLLVARCLFWRSHLSAFQAKVQ